MAEIIAMMIYYAIGICRDTGLDEISLWKYDYVIGTCECSVHERQSIHKFL